MTTQEMITRQEEIDKVEQIAPWQVTKAEWVKISETRTRCSRHATAYVGLSRTKTTLWLKWLTMHREGIQLALKQGKHIPQKVIAQYPELQL